MTPLSPGVLIAMYLVCLLGAVYLGMCLNNRMWRKRETARIRKAYQRGWDAGFGFLNRIENVKVENESWVKVIETEDASQ